MGTDVVQVKQKGMVSFTLVWCGKATKVGFAQFVFDEIISLLVPQITISFIYGLISFTLLLHSYKILVIQ